MPATRSSGRSRRGKKPSRQHHRHAHPGGDRQVHLARRHRASRAAGAQPSPSPADDRATRRSIRGLFVDTARLGRRRRTTRKRGRNGARPRRRRSQRESRTRRHAGARGSARGRRVRSRAARRSRVGPRKRRPARRRPMPLGPGARDLAARRPRSRRRRGAAQVERAPRKIVVVGRRAGCWSPAPSARCAISSSTATPRRRDARARRLRDVQLAHDGPAPHVLAIVLAGGEGRRLLPLTADRAKPAVPIGGRYRLIDFVLSNFVNSGLFKIKVLTQYKSDSLNTHIARGWRLPAMLDFYVEVGAGAAAHRAGLVPRLGRRHVPVAQRHHRRGARPRRASSAATTSTRWTSARCSTSTSTASADVTVAAIPVPVAEARAFGMLEVDDDGRDARVRREAGARRARSRAGPAGRWRRWATTSSTPSALVDELHARRQRGDSRARLRPQHPARRWSARGRGVYAYDFSKNEIPGVASSASAATGATSAPSTPTGRPTWTSCRSCPIFDLYNPRWPIRTWTRAAAAGEVRVRRSGDGAAARMGIATDSLVSEGCIISGGRIDRTRPVAAACASTASPTSRSRS